MILSIIFIIIMFFSLYIIEAINDSYLLSKIPWASSTSRLNYIR